MVKDAEVNAESDKEKREAVDTRNEAESVIAQGNKMVEEFADKMPASDKSALEAIFAIKI